MSVHQARLQIAAARERAAKLDALQQMEDQRTEKEAALEVRLCMRHHVSEDPRCLRSRSEFSCHSGSDNPALIPAP